MSSSPESDDADIYGDLPHFQFDEAFQKLEKDKAELQVKVSELGAALVEMKKLNDKLQAKVKALGKNISCLYKTAQREIMRKEEIIAELRKERDDLLFRRGLQDAKSIPTRKPSRKQLTPTKKVRNGGVRVSHENKCKLLFDEMDEKQREVKRKQPFKTEFENIGRVSTRQKEMRTAREKVTALEKVAEVNVSQSESECVSSSNATECSGRKDSSSLHTPAPSTSLAPEEIPPASPSEKEIPPTSEKLEPVKGKQKSKGRKPPPKKVPEIEVLTDSAANTSSALEKENVLLGNAAEEIVCIPNAANERVSMENEENDRVSMVNEENESVSMVNERIGMVNEDNESVSMVNEENERVSMVNERVSMINQRVSMINEENESINITNAANEVAKVASAVTERVSVVDAANESLNIASASGENDIKTPLSVNLREASGAAVPQETPQPSRNIEMTTPVQDKVSVHMSSEDCGFGRRRVRRVIKPALTSPVKANSCDRGVKRPLEEKDGPCPAGSKPQVEEKDNTGSVSLKRLHLEVDPDQNDPRVEKRMRVDPATLLDSASEGHENRVDVSDSASHSGQITNVNSSAKTGVCDLLVLKYGNDGNKDNPSKISTVSERNPMDKTSLQDEKGQPERNKCDKKDCEYGNKGMNSDSQKRYGKSFGESSFEDGESGRNDGNITNEGFTKEILSKHTATAQKSGKPMSKDCQDRSFESHHDERRSWNTSPESHSHVSENFSSPRGSPRDEEPTSRRSWDRERIHNDRMSDCPKNDWRGNYSNQHRSIEHEDTRRGFQEERTHGRCSERGRCARKGSYDRARGRDSGYHKDSDRGRDGEGSEGRNERGRNFEQNYDRQREMDRRRHSEYGKDSRRGWDDDRGPDSERQRDRDRKMGSRDSDRSKDSDREWNRGRERVRRSTRVRGRGSGRDQCRGSSRYQGSGSSRDWDHGSSRDHDRGSSRDRGSGSNRNRGRGSRDNERCSSRDRDRCSGSDQDMHSCRDREKRSSRDGTRGSSKDREHSSSMERERMSSHGRDLDRDDSVDREFSRSKDARTSNENKDMDWGRDKGKYRDRSGPDRRASGDNRSDSNTRGRFSNKNSGRGRGKVDYKRNGYKDLDKSPDKNEWDIKWCAKKSSAGDGNSIQSPERVSDKGLERIEPVPFNPEWD